MANISFGYQNRTDEGTLSGGSWMVSLPLSNLQDRVIAHVARSADAQIASTQFDLDLGQSGRFIGAIALLGHNLTVLAKIRLRGADTQANLAAGPLYDSGWVDVWPDGVIPLADLEWEEDNFWLGTLTAEQRAAYNTPFVHTFTRTIQRWWRVEIDDTTNSAGYVQVGRLFLSDLWSPATNMSYGTELSVEDRSETDTALGGVEYFTEQARYRVTRLSLDWLSAEEAYSRMLEIQRVLGVTGELLVIPDSDDTANTIRRTLIGRLLRISPINHAMIGIYRTTLEIRELL